MVQIPCSTNTEVQQDHPTEIDFSEHSFHPSKKYQVVAWQQSVGLGLVSIPIMEGLLQDCLSGALIAGHTDDGYCMGPLLLCRRNNGVVLRHQGFSGLS